MPPTRFRALACLLIAVATTVSAQSFRRHGQGPSGGGAAAPSNPALSQLSTGQARGDHDEEKASRPCAPVRTGFFQDVRLEVATRPDRLCGGGARDRADRIFRAQGIPGGDPRKVRRSRVCRRAHFRRSVLDIEQESKRSTFTRPLRPECRPRSRRSSAIASNQHGDHRSDIAEGPTINIVGASAFRKGFPRLFVLRTPGWLTCTPSTTSIPRALGRPGGAASFY